MKLIIFLMVVFISGCNSSGGSNDVSPVATPVKDKEQQLIEIINEKRSEGGICGDYEKAPSDPLKVHEDLELASEVHALDMIVHNFFGHTGSDGLRVEQRVKSIDNSWVATGEVLAKGYSNPNDVVEAWLQSESHCHILLSKYFEWVGVHIEDGHWVVVTGVLKENI